MRAHFQDAGRRFRDELPQTGEPSSPLPRITVALGNTDPAHKPSTSREYSASFADVRRMLKDQEASLQEVLERIDQLEQAIAILAGADGEQGEGDEPGDPNSFGEIEDDPSLENQMSDINVERTRQRQAGITGDRAGDGSIRAINARNRRHYKLN